MDHNDYELGAEATDQFRAQKPVGVVVSAQLERDIADRLIELREQEGKKLSHFVREAVLAYLDRNASRGVASRGADDVRG